MKLRNTIYIQVLYRKTDNSCNFNYFIYESQTYQKNRKPKSTFTADEMFWKSLWLFQFFQQHMKPFA